MKSVDVINYLIDSYGYRSYLEIGIGSRRTFDKVVCETKVGVDTDASTKPTHVCGSDEFFEDNKQLFDIIYIDGLHTELQTYGDIVNAMKTLLPGGTIVVHDCNPPSEDYQTPELKERFWYGEVWKAWVRCRLEYQKAWNFAVVDCDTGLGVIDARGERFGKSLRKTSIRDGLTYQGLEQHREEWLNLVPMFAFLRSVGEKAA